MAPLNIAILGAGLFAKEAHLPAIQIVAKSEDIKVTAVYSRSKRSSDSLAELTQKTLGYSAPVPVYADDTNEGIDALLARKDVDAVIAVLPIVQQSEILLKAFKAGKHVLSEKPIAKDVATGLSLIKTYETEYKPKGLIWRIAENFEHEPALRTAAAEVAKGKIGQVAFFKLVGVNHIDPEENKWYKTPWRTTPDYQGGFLLDGGVHSVALLRTILPGSFTQLVGFASLTKEYLPPHDTIQSVIQTSTGAHGILELSFAAPAANAGDSGISITGTDGVLRIANANKALKEGGPEVRSYKLTWIDSKGAQTEEFYPVQGVEKEIEYFAKAIAGSKDAEITATGEPRGALVDVAVVEAALTSNGKAIDLQKLVAA